MKSMNIDDILQLIPCMISIKKSDFKKFKKLFNSFCVEYSKLHNIPVEFVQFYDYCNYIQVYSEFGREWFKSPDLFLENILNWLHKNSLNTFISDSKLKVSFSCRLIELLLFFKKVEKNGSKRYCEATEE